MDPVKVVIFVVAFLLLLFLGRKLSSFSESASMAPLPQPLPTEIAESGTEAGSDRKIPTVVGADLPFPIFVPEIERDRDGKYNRPEFLNYYFEKTNLIHGPQDPTSFYDDFYLLVRDIENNHTALYKYFVATPAGLQKALAEEHLPALYLEDQSLIIAKWDVPLILEAAVKQIMLAYTESQNQDNEAHALPDPDAPETSEA
jgi:hypothetical protein